MFIVAAPGFQTVRTSGDVETQRPNSPLNIKLVRSVAPLTSPTSTLTGAEIQALLDAAEQAAAAGNVDAAVAGYRDILTKVPVADHARTCASARCSKRAGDTAGALAAYRDLARARARQRPRRGGRSRGSPAAVVIAASDSLRPGARHQPCSASRRRSAPISGAALLQPGIRAHAVVGRLQEERLPLAANPIDLVDLPGILRSARRHEIDERLAVHFRRVRGTRHARSPGRR